MKLSRVPSLGAALVLLQVGSAIAPAQIVAPPTPPVVPPAAIAPPPPAPTPAPILLPEVKPAEFNTSPMVRVDVLMVSVAEEKLLPLLRQLRDPAKIDAAEQQLLEMISRKEAKLEGWPEITTYSQVRAVSEAIVERRYPIEFEIPGKGKFSETKSAKTEGTLIDEGLGGTPTAFETRNTGATLEVEPIVSPDGTAVSLSLSPQLVRLESFADFPAGITAKGEKLTISQPIFTTAKISTSLTLKDGERRLIHVGKSSVDNSQLDVFILGAKVIPATAGGAK